MIIKAIVFDFDGTLTNGRLYDYKNLHYFFKKYYPDLSDMEYEAMIQDLNRSDIYVCGPGNFEYRCHQYLDKYHITADMIQELQEYWETDSYQFADLRYNAMEVVQILKKKYKIGILTNGGLSRQYNKVEKAGLKNIIDAMAVSSEIGVRKPEAKMYEAICQRLDVRAEECVFVGDSFSGDILGAYRIGMVPVWYVFDADQPGGSMVRTISDLSQLHEQLKEIEEK